MRHFWMLALVPFLLGAEASALDPDEREQISTLRVESLTGDEEGVWIDLEGYREIGSPTFSPDGQWIAFDGYKEGYNESAAEVWIVGRKGNDLARLAEGATPRWSPDGKRLLFMRERSADPDAKLGIFVIDRDGKNEQWICEGRWPEWAPDGKQIAFARTASETLPGGVKEMSRVYTANPDGSDAKLICDGDSPSWSPDGKRLACCHRDPAYAAPVVRIVDLETKTQRLIGYGWFRANWLPDGKHVVANGVDVDKRVMGMVMLSTNKSAKAALLFETLQRPLSPCCSADGKYLVFVADRPAFSIQRPGQVRVRVTDSLRGTSS